MREYRIDLVADLPHLTWRRFLVLLRGLSGNSGVAALIRARTRKGGSRAGSDSDLVTDPAEVDRVLREMAR